jgi:hypothetical protein
MIHKIISIYSKDVDMLIKCLEYSSEGQGSYGIFLFSACEFRAKWNDRGKPHTNVGGLRHNSEFKVSFASDDSLILVFVMSMLYAYCSSSS